MHELTIAQGILDIALKTAASHEASKVIGVKVLAGELTGIVPEALEFGFTALAEGSPAAGARLTIQIVPLVIFCRNCREQSRVDKCQFICKNCGSYAVEIITGRELTVESVEVE